MLDRDKVILKALEKFKVISRDQLIKMFFQGVNQPVIICNRVMRRLRNKGFVSVDHDSKPYNYSLNPSGINMKSTKVLHYLAIVDFYIEICKIEHPPIFEVEYKVGPKGWVEPDILMGPWCGNMFYVEIQRTPIHNNLMLNKYENYSKYYESQLWKNEYWQPTKKEPIFPTIWLYADKPYNLPNDPIQVYQSDSIADFYKRYIS